MKKLFIYYSLSGNGEVVADYLKSKKIDIRKVIPKKKLPKKFFLRIMVGGFLAGINHKEELVNFNDDISNYDEIIIGSPIWNGRLSCPINTALDKLNIDNKKVTFILYSGSGDAPVANKMLKQKYDNIDIIQLKEPKKNRELLVKALKNI